RVVVLPAAAVAARRAAAQLRPPLLAAVAGAAPGHGAGARDVARAAALGPPMSAPRRPFWHRPGWGQFGYFVRWALAVGLWFAVIFYGSEYLISLHRYRVRVHLDAELNIPFMPASVL